MGSAQQRYHHAIGKDNRKSTSRYSSITSLDIEKAYDNVWRKALIIKLIRENIPTHLVGIIDSFLTNRKIEVKIQAELSTELETQEGLPQGSVLAPVLFNLFINDIPKGEQTQLALFADETAIISESLQLNLAKIYTQRHLEEIARYFHKWKIKINAAKTQTITLTKRRGRPTEPLRIEGEEIRDAETLKYLGVVLDRGKARHRALGARTMMFPYIQKTCPLNRKLKLQL